MTRIRFLRSGAHQPTLSARCTGLPCQWTTLSVGFAAMGSDWVGRPLEELLEQAAAVRDGAHGTRVTYSPKVFIPLTMLCRDKCGYCTFAQPPARLEHPYLAPDQVLAIAA